MVSLYSVAVGAMKCRSCLAFQGGVSTAPWSVAAAACKWTATPNRRLCIKEDDAQSTKHGVSVSDIKASSHHLSLLIMMKISHMSTNDFVCGTSTRPRMIERGRHLETFQGPLITSFASVAPRSRKDFASGINNDCLPPHPLLTFHYPYNHTLASPTYSPLHPQLSQSPPSTWRKS